MLLCCIMATLSWLSRKGLIQMNLEKFTDRAKGFLQAAQTIAIRMNHQRIGPEHVAKALLEGRDDMAAGLIQRDGGDTPYAVQGVDALLAKDRKSVVYGKSVSVRVDTGGGRIIKKTKQIT